MLHKKLSWLILFAGFLLIFILAGCSGSKAAPIAASSSNSSGSAASTDGSLTIDSFPNSGQTCYIAIYEYSGDISDAQDMATKMGVNPPVFARGTGVKSPFSIDKKLNGAYFVTTNIGQKNFCYFTQVQFVDGKATVDMNKPKFVFNKQ